MVGSVRKFVTRDVFLREVRVINQRNIFRKVLASKYAKFALSSGKSHRLKNVMRIIIYILVPNRNVIFRALDRASDRE